MIFDADNCHGSARVHDVDSMQELTQVESIDIETGEIVRFHMPLRVGADGEASRFRERYRSIYPIFGGFPAPVLFHCYGRMAA